MGDRQQATEDAVFRGAMRAVGATVGVLLLVVLIGWIVVAAASSNDDLDCSTRNLERSAEGLPAEDC